jgi:hypothetical protein
MKPAGRARGRNDITDNASNRQAHTESSQPYATAPQQKGKSPALEGCRRPRSSPTEPVGARSGGAEAAAGSRPYVCTSPPRENDKKCWPSQCGGGEAPRVPSLEAIPPRV